jgi:hypothetical protein
MKDCSVKWECNVFVFLHICKGWPLWSSGQRSWLQNGDVLWFMWGTNWIYICYVEESRPPLWSSGQSSWLQNGDVLWFMWGTNWIYICYVEETEMCLATDPEVWVRFPALPDFLWSSGSGTGPLSLLSTTEELLDRKGTDPVQNAETTRDPPHWPRGTLYPQKLALTSPTSDGRSVSIVCSWIQAMEFSF